MSKLRMGEVLLTLMVICAVGSANPIQDRLVDSKSRFAFIAVPSWLQLFAHREGDDSTSTLCHTYLQALCGTPDAPGIARLSIVATNRVLHKIFSSEGPN